MTFHSSLSTSARSSLTTFVGLGCAIAATVLFFYGPLVSRVHSLQNPYSFSGDALQHIAPFWHIREPAELSRDYILNYYYQAILPVGYKVVYFLVTEFLTPPVACKLVAVLLSFLFIGCTVASTRYIAGTPAAFVSLVLATGAVIKNSYFIGGLQRGFGIALAAFMINALLRGNFRTMCVVTLLSFSLYPAGGILCMVALVLFSILPSSYGGDTGATRTCQRVLVLGCLSICIIAVVAPQLVGGSRYGERLSLENEQEFAEWGPAGRYTQGDRGVPIPLWSSIYSESVRTLVVDRPPTSEDSEGALVTPKTGALIVLASIVLCCGLVWWLDGFALSLSALRLTIFAGASVGSYLLATGLFPLLYIPSRYVILAVPCLIPIIVPSMINHCASRALHARGALIKRLATVLIGCIVCVALGWHSLQVRPLSTVDGYRDLFRFMERLPRDVVIAGWPRGVLSTIPFFTGRSVLIYEEGHQIFHRDFLLEMRRRMDATVAVFGAIDATPLQQLRQDFKVTHLLITRTQLQKTPRYFAPFGDQIARLRESRRGQTLYLEQILERCVVFKAHNLLLLDLSRLDPQTGGAADEAAPLRLSEAKKTSL